MEEITKLIDGLEPRAVRYDTPVADDLVLCTFPNGIKTWIFVSTTNGATSRRSIGVYPEMSLADARHALVSARKLQRVEDHLVEHGLASEIFRAATPEEARGIPAVQAVQAARRWLEKRTIGAAIAGGLMGMAILLGLRQLPYEFFFSTPTLASDVTNAAAPVAASPAAPAPQTASPTAADVSASVAKAKDAAAPEPVAAMQEAAPAASAPAELSAANKALLQAQEKLRGSVSRDVLARGVEADRPVDRFDTRLALDADRPTTLYYFTDVRGMAGKTVLHRWLHEGKLISEVALQVGDGWLSTLHSSTTIAPDMTGRWEVRVCDASGKALEQETFELTATTQLTSR